MDNTNTVPSTNISLNYNAAVGRLMPIEALNQRKKWMEDNNWNDITPGRELPSDIKYMVVDVETHDWRLNSGYKNGRIVEIAWMVFNHGMKCLESKQYILKPHGYNKIAEKSTEVHGITTDLAIEHGSDPNIVFEEFISIVGKIPRDGYIIAYNMIHEHQIFNANLNKRQRAVWKNAPKCDVYDIQLWKYMPPGADPSYRTTSKWKTIGIKLVELHQILCPGSTIEFVHTSIADVRMTWDIFRYYLSHASREELLWECKQPGLMFVPGAAIFYARKFLLKDEKATSEGF